MGASNSTGHCRVVTVDVDQRNIAADDRVSAEAAGVTFLQGRSTSPDVMTKMAYAARHADRLAGLFLLAPYPGTGDVLAEIRAAGGAAAWCQQPGSTLDERAWWQWLGQESLKAQSTTPVYFGTGSADRFLKGQRMLADLLPEERVRVLPGSHQWATWKALWEDWLDHGPLARAATAQAAKGPFGRA